jgi:hypothetical protein
LFLVEEIERSFLRNCLSVVDSRVSNLEIDIVFTSHSLTINEQVKLTHT